jgi:hypothetical protein
VPRQFIFRAALYIADVTASRNCSTTDICDNVLEWCLTGMVEGEGRGGKVMSEMPISRFSEVRFLVCKFRKPINQNKPRKKKVKCSLVQALRLCTGRTALRGLEVKLYSFMTTVLEGGEGSASRQGRSLPPGKEPVPIVQEAGWAPGPVWTGAENIAPTGIRSPDCPARSQSLYRLRCPAQKPRQCFSIKTANMWNNFYTE